MVQRPAEDFNLAPTPRQVADDHRRAPPGADLRDQDEERRDPGGAKEHLGNDRCKQKQCDDWGCSLPS